MIFALAGTEFSMSPGPPWWAADPQQQWPANLADEFQAKLWDGCEMGGTWEAMYSDRRTELVCIGRELDHEAASAQLEACLLTSEEMVTSGLVRVMNEQSLKTLKEQGRLAKDMEAYLVDEGAGGGCGGGGGGCALEVRPDVRPNDSRRDRPPTLEPTRGRSRSPRPACRGDGGGIEKRDSSQRRANTEVRPGDWECLNCGFNNFASTFSKQSSLYLSKS